jgi:hypothetical protein
MGTRMKKWIVAAMLLAAATQQPLLAADKAPDKAPAKKAACAPASAAAAEAEHGIRFMTDVMVVSSACQDTIYGEFRNRNQKVILAYQKTLITHMHGNKNFDAWNTSLANKASQKYAGRPTQLICQDAAEMMKLAKSFDEKGFRQYAASQAQTAGVQPASCSK